jgi:hypothetical protein
MEHAYTIERSWFDGHRPGFGMTTFKRAFRRGFDVVFIGLATATINGFLDALCRNVSYSVAAFYVKLHTGDPGSAGANNAAGNTTRQQATFSAASGGSITNSADIVWTNVSTSETYSHVSFWTASSGGTYLGNDDLASSQAVVAGNNFRIAAGSLTITGT